MIEWLADNVSVFKMQHDAHRELHLSVTDHLAHRERIGNSPVFAEARDRDLCIARDHLWELRVILHDGTTLDLAGSSLGKCIAATQKMMARHHMPTLAA